MGILIWIGFMIGLIVLGIVLAILAIGVGTILHAKAVVEADVNAKEAARNWYEKDKTEARKKHERRWDMIDGYRKYYSKFRA